MVKPRLKFYTEAEIIDFKRKTMGLPSPRQKNKDLWRLLIFVGGVASVLAVLFIYA